MKWLTNFFIMPHYSFFEILSILLIVHFVDVTDNYWLFLLYVPLIIVSVTLQRMYERQT